MFDGGGGKKKRRILICGGRHFNDHDLFRRAMSDIAEKYFYRRRADAYGNCIYNVTIIEGGASGVDRMAADWADVESSALAEYPADWLAYGKSAGHVRNMEMIKKGKPDLVVAFSGGMGTQMMIDMAIKADIDVINVSRHPVNGNNDSYLMVHLNKGRPKTFQTELYVKKYIASVMEYRGIAPKFFKAQLYDELLSEETAWLANMGKDYDEIMQGVNIFDEIRSDLSGEG